MPLQSGSRLGPYEVLERIGAGGMGEVYRAHDTRLSRSVAIKVLPSEFVNDANLRARLQREAKAISSLNHPHICTLHDVGHENGTDYLVLELCEGQTLAQRLERGALPVELVLRYGFEIADALSRAHRAGIIHRDLKPSNVMLTKSGVKLLDFGLAKQLRAAEPGSTTSLQDELAGTVQYMAPEVLRGKEADARSDTFALGLVLYEMITGTAAFSGGSKASVIASILEHDPRPVREVRPDVSSALEHVIEKCLAKDPDERWESAHDVAEELRWAARTSGVAEPARVRHRHLSIAFGAIAVAAASIAIWSAFRPAKSDRVVRLSIPLGQALDVNLDAPIVAISRDGSRIAIGGVGRLYVRSLDSTQTIPLAGTDAARAPFFSPDGQWVGFVSHGRLMKVPVSGGQAETLYSEVRVAGRGATWSEDGTIYFSPGPSTGIWKVPAAGGKAEKVTEPDAAAGENSHRWPHILPGGKHIVFTIRTHQIASFDDARIGVLSLESGTWKTVLEGGTCARYAATGDLLFGRAGALYAVPFDLKSMKVKGARRVVHDGVATLGATGAANFGVSDSGDLAYVPGGALGGRAELAGVDAAGEVTPVNRVDFLAEVAALSPDGRTLAMSFLGANNDIWLYDLERQTPTRLSFEPGDETAPVWTRDGSRVIYLASGPPPRIVVKNSDGRGEPEELMRGKLIPVPSACTPDGRFVAYSERTPETGSDLWLLPLDGERKAVSLLRTPFNEVDAQFSPDGKWIAYASDETGRSEVYIRRAAEGSGRWQVSSDFGTQPRWSADGKAVYFRGGGDPSGLWMAGIEAAEGEVRIGHPRQILRQPGLQWYVVAKDRLLVQRNLNELPSPPHVNVVVNWIRELERDRR